MRKLNYIRTMVEDFGVFCQFMKCCGLYFTQVAAETHGHVGADLASLCSEAALQQVCSICHDHVSLSGMLL